MWKRLTACCALFLIQSLLFSCTISGKIKETDISFDTTDTNTITECSTSAMDLFIQEIPDSAGSGNVIFDIYQNNAEIDLDSDGNLEKIVFKAGKTNSFLYIDDRKYVIYIEDLAQKFAIIDIDIEDNIYEILLTDAFDPCDTDKSIVSSYIFWLDIDNLKQIGTMTGVAFTGSLRERFKPNIYFDAKGTVFIPKESMELVDVFYMGRYLPSGKDRQLVEELYITKPINDVEKLNLKPGYMCALLYNIDDKYFSKEYNVIWDYASWPHINGREIDPEPKGVFSIIAVGSETLEVIKLYGDNWLMLRTKDGYEGWICVANNKIRGYDNVMYIDVFDMFE
jgi:hypothetical protein